jgi:5'-nucleotidase
LLAIEHAAPTCLNINFPDVDAASAGPLTPTRQGVGLVKDIEVLPHVDPRGMAYYWLRFQRGARANDPDSETAVVASGRVSVTPLAFDRTDEPTFARLAASLR